MSSKFSSKVLEVFAETGERFSIHESILKSLSGKLDQMLMASDKELELGFDLSSWNEATVERLIEYAYTGDYHCPNPVPLGTPSSGPGPVVDNDDSKSQPTKPAKTTPVPENTDTTRPLTPLHECFHAGPDPEEKISQAEIYREIHLDPSRHDFKETFLAHAQLYSLARHFEIEALWTLALQRLMRTLIDINFIKSNYRVASNFTDLVKFSYEKTSSPEDPLRRIISQFAALFFTDLQNEDMKDCIKQCGDFASELMGKVCRRLMVTEMDLLEKEYSHMCELAAERERNKRLEKLLTPIVVNSKPDLGDTKSASSVPATGGLFGSTNPIPSVSRSSSPAVGGSGDSGKPVSGRTSGSTNPIPNVSRPSSPAVGSSGGSGKPVSGRTSGSTNTGSGKPASSSTSGTTNTATGGLFGGTKPTTPPVNGGSFGSSQPDSPTSTAGGIFGNTKPASGNTQPANPTPTAAGLFGSAKPVPGATRPDIPAAGSPFGSAGSTFGGAGSTFGSAGSTFGGAANPFGSTANPCGSASSPFGSGSSFGSASGTRSPFGQPTKPAPASTGLFGMPAPASTNTSSYQPGPKLFDSTNPTPTATGGLFGAQPKKSPSPFDTIHHS